VNNAEGGEVHFHFHGGAPNIDQQPQTPRAAPKKGAPPSVSLQADKGPAMIGLEAAPDAQPKDKPRKRDKDEAGEKPLKVKEPVKPKESAPKDEDAKKINEDAELVARTLVQTLFLAF
jgi:hypothetical protein